MASNTISILITAKDQASPALAGVAKSVGNTTDAVSKQDGVIKRVKDNWAAFAGVAVVASQQFRGLVDGIGKSIDSSNKLDSALTGLSSVAEGFGHDVGKAKRAAQELASDGLMTVSDAATGLKNLLAAGFNLDEATTLMNRFKDSAAFGRQSSLNFGDAVRSATEGVKNGNSILVDNAGVTKNLSVMLTEAGYSAQDLMRASEDAGVRQAIFNGILKETNVQVGDAAKLTSMAAGDQAKWSAQIEVARQRLGSAFKPALSAVLRTVTPLLEKISEWIGRNPQLVTGIAVAAATFLALAGAIGAVGTAVALMSPLVTAVGGPWMIAFLGIATVISALAGGSAVLAGNFGQQRREQDQLYDSTKRLQDAQNQLRDSQLRLEGANLSVERAQLSYNDAVEQYGPKSLEAREAAHNLKRAQQELKDATAEAAQKQRELTTAEEIYSDPNRVSMMAGAARTVSGAISGISGSAKGAAAEIGTLSAKIVGLNKTGGIPKATGGISIGGSAAGLGGGTYKGRATGGPVSAGRPYIVGENEPELFVPNQSGRILNQKQMAEAGIGGGTTVNNVLSGTFNFENKEAVGAFFDRLDKTQRLARMGMA